MGSLQADGLSESADRIHNGHPVTVIGHVRAAWQLDEARARNLLGHPACTLDRNVVLAAMKNERRHADSGKDAPDVDLGIHPRQLQQSAGTDAEPVATSTFPYCFRGRL